MQFKNQAEIIVIPKQGKSTKLPQNYKINVEEDRNSSITRIATIANTLQYLRRGEKVKTYIYADDTTKMATLENADQATNKSKGEPSGC